MPNLMAAPIAIDGTILEPGPPVALFQTRMWGGGVDTYTKHQYDVAPDGRFLVNVTTDEATASPITVILNWAAGANR